MSNKYICTSCGYIVKPKKITPGNLSTEIILWSLFLFPGILYSIWRLTSKQKICPICKSLFIIPINSPKGKKIMRANSIRPCKTCGREMMKTSKVCHYCEKEIINIVNNLNIQLDIFDEENISNVEKKVVRSQIVDILNDLDKFDSITLNQVIKETEVLNIKKYIEYTDMKKEDQMKKDLEKFSQNIINLIEKSEKYKFVKNLEKERNAVFEVLYEINKKTLTNNDFKYLEKINSSKNIDKSFYSIEYYRDRLEYLESVISKAS